MAAPLALAIPIHIQIGDISRRDSLVCLAKLIYAAYDTSSWLRLETTGEPRIFRQHKDTSEISVSSQESLRGSCYPTAENRARNLLIDVVEWVHRAFHPSLVYLQVDVFVSILNRVHSPSHVVMAIK